jgi:hypothetical protein
LLFFLSFFDFFAMVILPSTTSALYNIAVNGPPVRGSGIATRGIAGARGAGTTDG